MTEIHWRKGGEELLSQKRINVLSIDWDYFIDASLPVRHALFPDGGNEDLAEQIRSVIWLGLYASKPQLESIGILKTPLQELIEVITENSSPQVKVMMADSHKHIYNFIQENKQKMDAVNLVNIDFHHDAFKPRIDVNCGNWLTHALSDFPPESQFTWIARQDSPLEDIHDSQRIQIVREDFSLLFETEWDLIYICRSGMWSPPHLDETFIKAFGWLTEEHYLILEQDILTSRHDSTFQENVQNFRKMYYSMNPRRVREPR